MDAAVNPISVEDEGRSQGRWKPEVGEEKQEVPEVAVDVPVDLGDLYTESGQTLQGSFSAGYFAGIQISTRFPGKSNISGPAPRTL